MLKNNATEYGLISVMVHWLSALLVVGLFAVGLYMVDLTYYDPLYHELPEWHKTFGVVLALITLFRLSWITLSRPPAVLAENRLVAAAARLGHGGLLLLLLILPITGYLISTAEGKPLMLFDWQVLPALRELSPEQTDLIGEVHELGAWALILMALFHAGAALKHHFIDHDKTLIRMLYIKR